jgi:hypothetical protein
MHVLSHWPKPNHFIPPMFRLLADARRIPLIGTGDAKGNHGGPSYPSPEPSCDAPTRPHRRLGCFLSPYPAHTYMVKDEHATLLRSILAPKDRFHAILTLPHDETGVDFALYRENTIQRRILRRLASQNIRRASKNIASGLRTISASSRRDLLIKRNQFLPGSIFHSQRRWPWPRPRPRHHTSPRCRDQSPQRARTRH